MSKKLFELMRGEELSTLYAHDFSKKEAILTGKRMVDDILEKGEVDKMLIASNLIRLNEVVGSAITAFREKLIDVEKGTYFGIEYTPVNGGESLNYKDDPIYLDIFNELKDREELIKTAHKSKNEIYDEAGVLVPKVSSTPRKNSITIKF